MKYIKYTLLIIGITVFSSFGNRSKCQSVQDKIEIKELLDIAKKTSRDNPDSSKIYIDKALDLATNLKYSTGIYQSKVSLVKYYRYKGMFDKSLQEIERIKESDMPDSLLVKVYLQEGIIQREKSNYDQSIIALDRTIELAKEIKDYNYLISGKRERAGTKLRQKQYLAALEGYTSAIEDCKKYKLQNKESAIQVNMALVYHSLKRYEEAKTSYTKALKIYEKSGDKRNLAAIYSNIGTLYTQNEKYKEAEASFKKALDIYTEINNEVAINDMYKQLAYHYGESKDYKQSENYFLKALPLTLKKNLHYDAMQIYYGLAIIHDKYGNYGVCKDYIKKAEEIAKSKEFTKFQKNLLKLSIKSELRERNQQGVLQSFEDYNALVSSIYSEDSQKQINEFIEKYKSEEKEQLIQLQKSDIEKNSILIQRQKVIQRLMLGMLTFFFLLIGVFYFFNRKIKQKNKELSSLNNNIQEKNNDLQSELKEKLLAVSSNSKIINDAINIIKPIKELPPERKKELLNVLESRFNRKVIEEIDLKFLRLHENFSSKLLQKHPSLTPNNLKMSIYLKMNLSTKEIAALQFKSPESVKVSRSRLRKKLGIPVEVKLHSYLSSI